MPWAPSSGALRLPFAVLGIDSDNDGVFINETLVGYCTQRGIEFIRSRAYRKNDQAWIEQKNGSVVRRFVGHDRYSGQVAGQTMARLYQAVRLYVNDFQSSLKLLDKVRDGSRVIKRYSPPATPCDRLMQADAISDEMKEQLKRYRFSCSIRFRRSGSCWWRKPGEVLGSPSQPVARRGSPAYTQSADTSTTTLANQEGPLRRCVVRGAVVTTGAS